MSDQIVCDLCGHPVRHGDGYVFYSSNEVLGQVTGNMLLCERCTKNVITEVAFTKAQHTNVNTDDFVRLSGQERIEAVRAMNAAGIVQVCKIHGFTPTEAREKARELALAWWAAPAKAEEIGLFWKYPTMAALKNLPGRRRRAICEQLGKDSFRTELARRCLERKETAAQELSRPHMLAVGLGCDAVEKGRRIAIEYRPRETALGGQVGTDIASTVASLYICDEILKERSPVVVVVSTNPETYEQDPSYEFLVKCDLGMMLQREEDVAKLRSNGGFSKGLYIFSSNAWRRAMTSSMSLPFHLFVADDIRSLSERFDNCTLYAAVRRGRKTNRRREGGWFRRKQGGELYLGVDIASARRDLTAHGVKEYFAPWN